MRLRIFDHLHAVLDRAQQAVCLGEFATGALGHSPAGEKRFDRVECGRRAHRGVAPAVNHLLNLDEELDLANTAAPTLQIVTWADLGAFRKMIADSSGYLADVFDDSKVQRATPDERPDGVEKTLAQAMVAGGGSRPDEGRALPRQCAR